MNNLCSRFTVLQLLLMIGSGCDAFLGGHIHKRTSSLPVETMSTTSTSLLYSQNPSSSNSSSLLQGKVSILQDVVKEMDARHQELLEESTKAQQEYTQKLEILEKDLEASKATKGDHQSAIEKLESTLEETIEQHAKDLDQLQQNKDEEHQQETQQLRVQNEESLEKLRKAFEEHVEDLEMELEAKNSQVEDLSAKLQTSASSDTAEDKEKDVFIEELKKQIEAQTKQLDSIQKEASEQEKTETTSEPSEASVIVALKAEHRETVEDFKDQIDALAQENQKLSEELAKMDASYKAKLDDFCDARNQKLSELEAKHQWVVEDYESRLDAIFAEKEEVSKDLQQSHQEIIAGYETKLEETMANSDKLSSELKTMQAKCEEQVAIAEASVKAGQAREADLQGETRVLLRRVQVYWIAAKLTNVLSETTEHELAALWKERDQLESENGELRRELETTKKGVQDLIEQLENQNTLWQKLRSKVTGK